MTKILIIGFRHSGTTMLMKLLRSHPQVGWIEDEESFIEFDKPKEWMIMMASKRVPDLKHYAWGEKIPWGTRENDLDGERALNMAKKWLKYFKPGGRVLHILRHPLDVALSGHSGNVVGKKDLKYILSSVPSVIEYINKAKRASTIVYEDLLMNPELHLTNIFKFLNLNSDKDIVNKVINTPLKFGKINADRAFAYRQKDVKINIDYDKFLKKVEKKL